MHDPLFQSGRDGLSASLRTELVKNAMDVHLYGAFRDSQLGCDLPVRFTVNHTAQHAHLAIRQVRSASALREPYVDLRRDKKLASVSRPDRLYQHLLGAALEQVAFGACFEGPKDILVTTVSSENRDARVRVCAHDFLDGCHAIDFRHAQVHQNDIRAVAEKLVYSLSSVGGLGNHLHIPALIDDRSQAFANHGMIVRDLDSDHSFVVHLAASDAGLRRDSDGYFDPGAFSR